MVGGRRRGGFTAVEMVVVCVVVALVCCLAAAAGQHARKRAGLAASLANLKKIGEVTGNYAADFDGQWWSLNWTPDTASSLYDDLQDPATVADASAFQTTDILRRLFDEEAPRFTNRFGVYWTSTLVLADYLGESLPMEWVVSPGDKVRLEWQTDPDNPPNIGEQGGYGWQYAFCGFGSSYELMPAFFAPDEATRESATVTQYLLNHNFSQVPNQFDFAGRRHDEVLFPGQKVHMAERASYFFGPTPAFYLHAVARVPVLMADGAAAARTTGDANASFYPANPDNQNARSRTAYYPNTLFEVPTLGGSVYDSNIDTYYKWTRRGLRGIDFSGERAE